MAKPTVKTKCVANSYTENNERIIEFSSENGGGLILFRNLPNGTLLINVYRADSTVRVSADPKSLIF